MNSSDFHLDSVMGRHVSRLLRLKRKLPESGAKSEWIALLDASKQELEQRRSRSFSPTYPDLPICAHRDAIKEAIRNHPVVLVQGGTGSGKSTQLPKILLEMGLSARGWVGCTQPRRLAALSITDRLREEMGEKEWVACKIRFHEESWAGSEIKIMTDGVLLQEASRDPLFNTYQAIILDEAHERSLNIDLLMGLLKVALQRRSDLKVVLSSATMDVERLQGFFPGSPVLQVGQRLHPVTIEYWDPEEREAPQKNGEKSRGSDYLDRMAEAIVYLQSRKRDHLLAFLPTEKDILELRKMLEKRFDEGEYWLLPLFGRLSPQDQKKVFSLGGAIKIVLATNIAETSLTIPGIAYVVDSGLARIARFHTQTKIQGLPVEPIARASAEQRAGRAGRVKPGHCIRLYSEEDLLGRPEHTEPEIRRSNLANVVLHLLSLRIRDLDSFPFPEPPAPSALRSALRQLHELGAVSEPEFRTSLTREGVRLSRLPVDVSLAKVMLMGQRLGPDRAVLIIAAATALPDPRYLPQEEGDRAKAEGLHARFKDKRSDFMGYLLLWNFLMESWPEGSTQNRLRKLCNENYLAYFRVREWLELVDQFAGILQLKSLREPVVLRGLDRDAIHKALLSGHLSSLAQKRSDGPGYRLAGQKEAWVARSSALYRSQPAWILAAGIRQTSRTFLQCAGEVRPEWVEELAPQFCKPSYEEPHFHPRTGFVQARERVHFRGFLIRGDRSVDYARVAPEEASRIFWLEAIAAGELKPLPAFAEHNARSLKQLEKRGAKLRAALPLPGEEELANWYYGQAPDVNSRHTLDAYIQRQGDAHLRFSPAFWAESVLPKEASAWLPAGAKERLTTESFDLVESLFPDSWALNAVEAQAQAKVACIWDEGNRLDGISLEAGLDKAPQLAPRELGLRIPGWARWTYLHLAAHHADLTQALAREAEVAAAWRKLEEAPGEGPRTLAAGLFAAMQACGFTLVSRRQGFSWPTHLKIHLKLYEPATQARHLLEIDPSMGAAAFCMQLRKLNNRHHPSSAPGSGAGPHGGGAPIQYSPYLWGRQWPEAKEGLFVDSERAGFHARWCKAQERLHRIQAKGKLQRARAFFEAAAQELQRRMPQDYGSMEAMISLMSVQYLDMERQNKSRDNSDKAPDPEAQQTLQVRTLPTTPLQKDRSFRSLDELKKLGLRAMPEEGFFALLTWFSGMEDVSLFWLAWERLEALLRKGASSAETGLAQRWKQHPAVEARDPVALTLLSRAWMGLGQDGENVWEALLGRENRVLLAQGPKWKRFRGPFYALATAHGTEPGLLSRDCREDLGRLEDAGLPWKEKVEAELRLAIVAESLQSRPACTGKVSAGCETHTTQSLGISDTAVKKVPDAHTQSLLRDLKDRFRPL